MESTCDGNKIQISQQTADLLLGSGKGSWVRKRENLVQVKGKGEMQTYWLDPIPKGPKSTSSGTSSSGQEAQEAIDVDMEGKVRPRIFTDATNRLIDWNVSVLLHRVTQVVKEREGATSVILKPEIKSELLQYVSGVAARYNDNPFHNFEVSCIWCFIFQCLGRNSYLTTMCNHRAACIPRYNVRYKALVPYCQYERRQQLQTANHLGFVDAGEWLLVFSSAMIETFFILRASNLFNLL
jgi:hypothetical protein